MSAPAYTALSLTLPQNLFSSVLDASGIAGPSGVPISAQSFPSLQALNLSLGNAVGSFNILGVSKGTLAAAPTSIDLTSMKDLAGGTVAFATVFLILIWNLSATAGKIILWDGTVANCFAPPFNAIATAKFAIGPGFLNGAGAAMSVPAIYQNLNPGGTVNSSTSKIIKLDPGADTIPYLAAVAGLST